MATLRVLSVRCTGDHYPATAIMFTSTYILVECKKLNKLMGNMSCVRIHRCYIFFSQIFEYIYNLHHILCKRNVLLGKCPSGQMSFRANVFWANVFLGKCLSGQMSSGQMSFWANVFLGKCLSGQMSFWANVHLGKCLLGKCLSGQTSFWANVVWANVLLGKCRMDKCRMGKCLWANVSGQMSSGQMSWNRTKYLSTSTKFGPCYWTTL
jgi:hypothetical protein